MIITYPVRRLLNFSTSESDFQDTVTQGTVRQSKTKLQMKEV